MRLCKFAATLSMLLHASLVISLPQGMTPVPLIQPGRVDLLQQLQLVKQAAMGGDPTVVYALVVGLFQSELRVSAGESMTSDTSTTSYYVAMMRCGSFARSSSINRASGQTDELAFHDAKWLLIGNFSHKSITTHTTWI